MKLKTAVNADRKTPLKQNSLVSSAKIILSCLLPLKVEIVLLSRTEELKCFLLFVHELRGCATDLCDFSKTHMQTIYRCKVSE